jgi:hypothetical protein
MIQPGSSANEYAPFLGAADSSRGRLNLRGSSNRTRGNTSSTFHGFGIFPSSAHSRRDAASAACGITIIAARERLPTSGLPVDGYFERVRPDRHDRGRELPELVALHDRGRYYCCTNAPVASPLASRETSRAAHDFLSQPDRDVRDDRLDYLLQPGVMRDAIR